MEYGQAPLAELSGAIAGRDAFVRAALERERDRWVLRTSMAVVGRRPPGWQVTMWEYEDVVLVSDQTDGANLASAFSSLEKTTFALGNFEASVPIAADQTSWRHAPSRVPSDVTRIPWPMLEYEVHRKDTAAILPQHGMLIGSDCPSFSEAQTGVQAFFYGNYSSFGAPTIPSQLARVRVVQSEAWIRSVRVTPTKLLVQVDGDDRVGARLEINSSTVRVSKRVGSSGRVQLALQEGLPDDGWLYLSRGKRWLDYRALGQRLHGLSDPAALGIVIDIPDDPESQLDALLTTGEGPEVEFKRDLPGDTQEAKRKVLKTVAAFANGSGGVIVFGMDPDEATVVGVEGAGDRGERDRMSDLIHGFVEPTPLFEVTSATKDGKGLVLLSVRAGQSGPYCLRFKNKPLEFYVRRGASSYPATQGEIRSAALSTPRQ